VKMSSQGGTATVLRGLAGRIRGSN
jgi:hypothetical protein